MNGGGAGTRPVIGLLTDFDLRDWYVGAMKGVIASIAPHAMILDITHGIRPGGIREAAFALRASYQCFPKGSVIVVVVDPGVGSERNALVVKTGNYSFVAPDNGVLSFVLEVEPPESVHVVENIELMRQPVSATFHGRDVFAPVGAHLAQGVALESFGAKTETWGSLPWPASLVEGEKLIGEIVYIDTFGNAITSLDASLCGRFTTAKATVQGRVTPDFPLVGFYQQSAFGSALSLIGSSGLLELSINGGSAAKSFGLEVGDRVEVEQTMPKT